MNLITRFTLLVCLLISSLPLTGQLVEGIDFEVGIHDLNTNLGFATDPTQILESEDGAFILYDRFLSSRENELFYFDGNNWESILQETTDEIRLIQAFQNGVIIEISDTEYEYWLVDEDSFSMTLLLQSNRPAFGEPIPFLDKLIFRSNDNLYITDGTTVGTQLLSPELEDYQGNLSITMFTDSLFAFFGDDKVYVSDGTAAGTRTIYEEIFSIDDSYGLYNINGRVIFKDWSEIISCDLTGSFDTVITQPMNDVFYYEEPIILGEQLLLPISSNNLFGLEWWRTDGTTEGSYMITDLSPGNENGLRILPVKGFPILNERLYFYGTDGNTVGIYSMDGSQEGISLMIDLADFPNRREYATSFELLGSNNDGSEVYFQTRLTDDIQHEVWGIGGSAGATPIFIGSLPGFTNTVDNIASGDKGLYFSQNDFNTPLEHAVVYGLTDPNEPINTIDSFAWIPGFWLEEADRLYFLGRPVDGNNDVPLRSAKLDDRSAKTYTGVFPMSSSFTINDEVYFINDDSIVNESVYRLNANENSPEKLIDIFPNNDGSTFRSIIREKDLFFILQSGNIITTSGNNDFATIYTGDLFSLNLIASTSTKTLFFVDDSNLLLTDGTVEGTVEIPPPPGLLANGSSIISFKDNFYYTTREIIDNQRTRNSLIRLDSETAITDTVFTNTIDQVISNSALKIAATESHLFFSESYERTNAGIKNTIKVYDTNSTFDLPNSTFTALRFSPSAEEQLYSVGDAVILEEYDGELNKVHLIRENLSTSHLIWKGESFVIPRFSFISEEAAYGVKSSQLIKSTLGNSTEVTTSILAEDVRYGPYPFSEGLLVYFIKEDGEDYQLKISDGTLNCPFQEEVFLDRNIPQWSIHNGSVVFLRNDSLFSYSVTSGRTSSYSFPESQLVNFNLLPEFNNRIYCTADNILLGNELHYLDLNIFQSTTGLTYHDANQNNQPDAEEKRLSNIAIIAQGTTSRTTFSNQEGDFSHYLRPEQAYTISALPDPCWELSTTPESYAITTDQDSIYTVNFGFRPLDGGASIRPLLSMARPRCGFTIPTWITLTNDGCEDLEYTSATVTLPEGVTLVSADSPPNINGNNLNWEPGPLQTGQSHYIYLELQMPGEEANGENITINLQTTGIYQFDLEVQSDYLFSQTLSCAIDPNDKQVTPSRAEPSNSNYTQNDETLTYTIRFQNTGTDTAFNVRLEDQLSDNLDHLTFKPIASSHVYRASMDEKGLVKVFFDNIMLPDSNANQSLSNGFFTFDVNTRPGLEDFTLINNTAGIFFDFNRPVITNTISNSIVEFLDEDEDDFLFYEECDDKNPDINPNGVDIAGNGIDENCDGEDGVVSTLNPLNGTLLVSPNPTTGVLNLSFSDQRALEARLYSLLGKEIQNITFRANSSLDVSTLPAGIYLLRVRDGVNGEETTRRVIKN